jgi:tetratricopeptide (TPR) repeat protein
VTYLKHLLLGLLLSGLIMAQGLGKNLGQVEGEVLDMRGRPIAGASVVYSNLKTGKVYTFFTDKSGRFQGLGLILGNYKVKITGPDGKHIYSSTRRVFPDDYRDLNAVQIDLSLLPTKASLVPFKGPSAANLQSAKWRDFGGERAARVPALTPISPGKYLSPEHQAELRAENSAIADYNELYPQVQTALKEQHWPEALDLLQKISAIAPFQWELYQNLGTVQTFLGRYAEAAESFEKSFQTLPLDEKVKSHAEKFRATMSQLLLAEGEAYSAAGNSDAAVSCYQRAAELDSDHSDRYVILHHLCVAEYNRGDSDAAIRSCQEAVAVDPARPESYEVLGQIQMNVGKYEDAAHTFEKGIELAEADMRSASPVRSNIHSNSSRTLSTYPQRRSTAGRMLLSAGNAYFQLKQYDQAAKMFARAVPLHPYPALAYFNLCAAYFDSGNLKGAAEACANAIDDDPLMADAYYVRGAALMGEGAKRRTSKAPESATAALQKYLQLASDGIYAADARALLQEAGN